MYIHMPKPLHGWRAFVGEVGIIVIGVLIALGAQQVIDELRWVRKVRAAEQMMNEEIKDSLLAVAEVNRLDWCSTVQLEALQDAIDRGDQIKARRILQNGTAFGQVRLWADNAFEASLSAQVSDHFGAAKLKSYSQIYQMIRDIQRIQTISETEPSDLALLYFFPTKRLISAEDRRAQLREVANSRLRMMSMRTFGNPLVHYAKKTLGLEVTQSDYLAAPRRAEIIKQCEAGAAQASSDVS